jgi:hypothetical protein
MHLKFEILLLVTLLINLSSIISAQSKYDGSVKVSRNIKKDSFIERDSLGISEKIRLYFSYDAVEVIKTEKIDLDNNKNTNEYIVVYLINDKIFKYVDIYLIKDDGSLKNLYHNEKYFDEDLTLTVISLNNLPFLMKISIAGSGSFLSCEIFKYDGSGRLDKVFEIPSNIGTFHGDYYMIKNEVFFKLSSKRYKLVLNKGVPELLPYTVRLQMKYLRNTQHLVTIDKQNDDLIVFYDGKKVHFSNNKEEALVSMDTLKLKLNDTCWIDDNCLIPASISYFFDPGYKFKNGLFSNLIFTKKGHHTLFFRSAYGRGYILNFQVN